jgi:lipopolysaccharide/colanic/teichoic acid biosynthesis glycosyltransferase
MKVLPSIDTVVTTDKDPRITSCGRLLRKTKIDELPKLINVFLPGITGPATLRFRNEEEILAKQSDPEKYNQEVNFPEKVRLNREYIENYRFRKDIEFILRTVFGG